MRITAHAGSLAKALAMAATGMRGNKETIAVRLVAADGRLTITACDQHTAIVTTIAAEVTEPGQAAPEADRLTALLSGYPAAAVITISANETTATITAGNSRSRLQIIKDPPEAISIDKETGRVEIGGEDCMALLSPLPAAAGEPTRYYLCGVSWRSLGNTLTSVATNGTVLISASIAADSFSPGPDLILPRQAAALLARLLKSARPSAVTLRRSKRLLAVTAPAFSFTAKLIDYDYPDVSRVIPPASSDAVSCDRAQLLAAIARLGAVATADPLLALSFTSAPKLDIYLAREPDVGRDAIEADTIGSGKVAVRISQFAEMIAEISGTRVRLEFTEGRPLRILGDGAKLALVMPCVWNFEPEKTARARPLGRDAEH